jgi:hypothetical protein
MGQSPFAKRLDKDPNLGRRRSSRIEFVTPVIVTGRDASGQPFREETETRTVNLHGAKIVTRHTVLVGMQVGVECPLTSLEAKAVCVQIGPSGADSGIFEMAVQLIVPGNIWGVENSPEDWGIEGPAGTGRREAPGRTSGVFFAGVRTAGMKEDSPFGPAAPSVAASAPALGSFEQRVAGILEKALADYEVRLKQLEADSQARLKEYSDWALDQLETFTQHSEDRLKGAMEERREELAAAIEETIRAKVGEMFAAMLNSPAAAPPAAPSARPPKGPDEG